MTPVGADDERHRRRLVAAEHLIVSGDMRRADEILVSVAAELADGPLRADVLTRRALLALYLSDVELAETLLRSAMPMTADDPRLRVTIHALLAGIGHLSWRGWRHARLDMWAALRLSHELEDAPLELQMLGHTATWMFGLGRPWRGLIERAEALAVPMTDVPALEHPDLQFARLAAREGHTDEGRQRLERLIQSARSAGDWTSLPRLLVSLAAIEFDAGSWDRAERIADDAQTGLLQTGEGAFYQDLTIVRLNLAVGRGDADAAHALGATIELDDRVSPKPLVRTAAGVALAMLDLSLGDPGGAHERLVPVLAEPGLGRLTPVRWESIVALEAEALLGLGRTDEARRILDPVEPRARRRGPPLALAEVLRARALVLAADGDHAGAVRSAEEAVLIHAGLQMPFRGALAWFTLGDVLRRSRQKAASRAAFQTALAVVRASSGRPSGSSERRPSWVAWRAGAQRDRR